MRRRQVNLDWDYGATGIWWVHTPEELAHPWIKPDPELAALPTDGWASVLSAETLADLQAWNLWGEQLDGMLRRGPAPGDYQAFRRRGEQLQARVQEQLGPKFDVRLTA